MRSVKSLISRLNVQTVSSNSLFYVGCKKMVDAKKDLQVVKTVN